MQPLQGCGTTLSVDLRHDGAGRITRHLRLGCGVFGESVSSVKDVAAYLRWRARGRPIDSIPAEYGPWVSAYDDLRPPTGQTPGHVSVVCPVFDTPPSMLAKCVRSVLDQSVSVRELILVDDGSMDPEIAALLARFEQDPLVAVLRSASNRGIASATNMGIDRASGDFIAFVDHDDELAPDAIEWLTLATRDADVIYTDEDQLTESGDRIRPFMKPAWSPRLLLGMNYVNHLMAVRSEVLRTVGGLDPSMSGAQDHDLLLRLSETPHRFSHIPKVLYHWRQSDRSVAGDEHVKPWALDAARRSVQAAVTRRGIDARIADAPNAGPYRFVVRFESAPGTSLIVSGSSSAEVNAAVRRAASDVVILTLQGISIDDGMALQLAGWLHDPSVAAVGPMIIGGNGSVVELGWIGSGGRARPYGHGHERVAVPFLEVAREVTAVGGVAVAIRRSDFMAVGGLNLSLPLHLAGVDLTTRLARLRDGVCIAEPAVTVDIGDHPFSTEMSPAMPFAPLDPFVSPHKTADGMTIDEPPSVSDRVSRIVPRDCTGSQGI